MIIYNNVPGQLTPSAPEGNITVELGGVTQEDGRKLFEYLQTSSRVKFLKKDQSFKVPTAGLYKTQITIEMLTVFPKQE